MRRRRALVVKLVTEMPAEKEEGILYISHKWGLAIYLCPCGCKNEAVTHFGPAPESWTLFMPMEEPSVATLKPSIANRFPCKSHYYITKNKVEWL